ncbi:MAG: aminoacyl-tRNA deacylase [Deltaproteobacteria bacterium]|nr:aminoacyl-tRNA deacylase [Deltaproteobacteria bacterium]MBW1792861.1 aminoacyl-tRNA deacylase [Deltaproteobacteria bacterium]
MATQAITFLNQKGIHFEVIEYEHKEKGAVFAAEAMGLPLERTIKTLVVDLGRKRYIIVLMPGDKNVDLKSLARAYSVQRAAMADTSTAERLTGYLVGGISPFGTKQNLPVVMEAGLLKFDKVAINAGERGVMLIMDPKDILLAVNGDVLGIPQN